MQEAKMMLEEYYGHVEHHGKWHWEDKEGNEVNDDYKGDKHVAWSITINHEGIIARLANEAQRIKERTQLGSRFMDRTFANFNEKKDPVAYKQCVAYANRENLFSDNKNGLMLFGGVGSGKTHLSASIANDFADKAIPTLFGTFSEHLEQIRSEFDSANADEHLRNMKRVMVLVIDDLGQEKQTEWTRQILYDVVNYRYEHRLPIIITTNFTEDGLANYVGHPVWSRLYEMCDAVHTSGGDHRMER